MDKLPRLRRKPKPPAIETSVRRASRDAVAADARPVDIMAPAVLSSLSPPGEPHQHPQHALALKSLSPVRKASPFRSFKIRASAKRARGSSPVDQPATASPVVAVFNQDGHAPHAACRSATHAQQQARPLRPEMPGFLTLSAQEIDRKFHEITWAERLRLADAHRNQHVDDYRWGHYQQLDCAQRGLMDRYSNIRPWNHNRVRLRVPDGEFDYVNASAVSLSSPSDPSLPPLRYIAMQGPTEPSFDCVWRMVAEQMPSPAVIVQLTMMHENGAVKCHQYFPHARGDPPWTLNEADAWADGWSARLTLASLHHAAEGAIEVRKLLLDVAGAPEPRVVWHLLYRRWPDFGVPTLQDMDGFLELMRLSRRHGGPPPAPRVVHCSAGVGRTGTFICLEHLLRELDGGALDRRPDAADPVFDTVEALRQQRRGMVQSESQFHFVYHVMRRLWRHRHGLGPLPAPVPEPPADDAEPAAKRLELVADPFLEHAADDDARPPAR